LPGAWGVPFYNSPEPQEALVVWEMVEHGDWVLPRRNAEEIPSKPPLYHWIAAAMSSVAGGVTELTVRVPSVLAAAATVGVVFRFAAAEWGAPAAIASAIVLVTSPEWARWAVTARTDQVFTFFVALAFLFGDRWMREPKGRWLSATAASAGAAMLAKGPAGALLPALALALQHRGRHAFRHTPKKDLVVAAVVFVVVAGSWYAAALWSGGSDFFRKQILAENVFRFLPEEGVPSREHPIFFYVPMILVGMLPWSIGLPFALVAAFRDRRQRGGEGPFTRHLLVWIGVVFAVCTIASGKRSNYVLPLYPATALLLGRHFSGLMEDETTRDRKAVRVLGFSTGVLLGAVAAILIGWRLGFEPWSPLIPFLHVRDRGVLPLVTAALGPPPTWLIVPVVVLSLALAGTAWRASVRGTFVLLGVSMLFATLVGSAVVRPVEARLKTFEPFARRVAARVDASEPMYFFRRMQYAVLFYLRRHVPVEYLDLGNVPRPTWLFVWEEDWNALGADLRKSAVVVDASPLAAPHRPDSRLFLVRLSD
jgi:4-amino-4-deoxy-L-arabinose transferase-like glycosyltransferase